MELYLSFSEILRFFKRHLWKFAVLTVACGVLLGVLSLKSFQRVYSATSTILVACTIDNNASPDYSNQYASMLNVRLQAAVAMADLEDFRVAVAERAGVEESSLNSITASQVSTSTLVDLTISTGDRDHAAALADAAAEEMAESAGSHLPNSPDSGARDKPCGNACGAICAQLCDEERNSGHCARHHSLTLHRPGHPSSGSHHARRHLCFPTASSFRSLAL